MRMNIGRGKHPGDWSNPSHIRCPKCRSTKLRKEGTVHGKQVYNCKNCNYKTTVPLKPLQRSK